MNKVEFFDALRNKISGLPKSEVEERLAFYSEMIDDMIEEGVDEENAILNIGDVDTVAEQIIAETSLIKLVKEKMKPKTKRSAMEITLIAVGSPIWISLLAAAFVVVIALFASVAAGLISMWAVFAACAACSLVGVYALIAFPILGNALSGIAFFGGGVLCAGLAILMFFACLWATVGSFGLTKKMLRSLKRGLVVKGGEK